MSYEKEHNHESNEETSNPQIGFFIIVIYLCLMLLLIRYLW